MQKNYGKQIGRATKWSGITEIATKLIVPVVNMVLARLLTPEAFGVVATITMVISFAELFTDAGFQKYIVQHEFRDEVELNNSTNVAFWTNLCFSALICLVIFLFREPIANLVGSPGLGNSISIASLLIIIAAFSSLQMARYKRDFDFKTLFFVRVGSALIPLVVTIPLAILLRNYWALLIGNIASHTFNAVVLTVKSKWRPSFYFNWKLLKEMFSFSIWTLLESIIIWLTSYIGIFIVGSYLDDYYLGLYKTSMSTVNAYMSIITSAVIPVLFSALSRYQNDEINFHKTYYSFQRIVAVFVLPMGVGIYLFRELVTQILLGSQWMEASGFIGLWGLTSAVIIVYSYFASEVHRSKGKPKISLATQTLHLLFVIPALLISVKLDFKTLYITRSLIRIQSLVTALLVMQLLHGLKITKVLKNTLPMILSTVVMGVLGYFLKQLSGSVVWHFAVIAICVVVYFAVLLGCFPKMRKELLESAFMKKILKKKSAPDNGEK